MLTHIFQINECDKCVYYKGNTNSCVIVCLYVDDIVGSNKDVINSTKKMLHWCFDMKDLGIADIILGIKITRNVDGYVLSQFHLIEKVLKRFGRFENSPLATPFDTNCNLKDCVSQLEYSWVLGNLLYVMNNTSKLSQYTSNPRLMHWDALVRVLRYLKVLLILVYIM